MDANSVSKPLRLLTAYVAAVMAFGFGVLVSSYCQWEDYGVAIGATIVFVCSLYLTAFALYRGIRLAASSASILIAFAIALMAAGCSQPAGPKQGPPPIEFSFRKAQIPTRGMVLGIKNAADRETLEKLTVDVRSPGEETPRSHVIETGIKPHDSITVGWVELDGWKLKPGDKVSVKVAGYSKAKTITVPKP